MSGSTSSRLKALLHEPVESLLTPSGVVNEKYSLLSRINEGVYGVVWKARCRSSGKLVALKRVKAHKSRSGFPLASIREVSAYRWLSGGPSMAELLEVVVSAHCHSVFLVLALAPFDLAHLMQGAGVRWHLREAKCIFQQLLRGVAFMHRLCYVHRDLKSANILLTESGQLQICDLGLTRRVSMHSFDDHYSNCVVTLWYRAPEIVFGAKHYGLASDNWSAACLMAELLTGAVLFPANGELAQMRRILAAVGSGHFQYLQKMPHFARFCDENWLGADLKQRFPIGSPLCVYRGKAQIVDSLTKTHFGIDAEDESGNEDTDADDVSSALSEPQPEEALSGAAVDSGSADDILIIEGSLDSSAKIEDKKMSASRTRVYECDSDGFEVKASGPLLSAAGFQLLSRMLCVDPNKRLTAAKALESEWFAEEPKSCEPREIRLPKPETITTDRT